MPLNWNKCALNNLSSSLEQEGEMKRSEYIKINGHNHKERKEEYLISKQILTFNLLAAKDFNKISLIIYGRSIIFVY
jgi:hypothetical protein